MYGEKIGIKIIKYYDLQYMICILLGVIANFVFFDPNNLSKVILCVGAFDVIGFVCLCFIKNMNKTVV